MISGKHVYLLILGGLQNAMVLPMGVPHMLPPKAAETAELTKRIAHVWRNTYRGLYTVDWDAAAARWIADGRAGITPAIRAAYKRQTSLSEKYFGEMTEFVTEDAHNRATRMCANEATALTQSNQIEQEQNQLV